MLVIRLIALMSSVAIVKSTRCETVDIQFESPWKTESKKHLYQEYSKGLPKSVTWYSFFDLVSLPKSDIQMIKDCYKAKFDARLPEVVKKQMSAGVDHFRHEVKVYASDFLCLFDANKVYLCNWEHFAALFASARQLFRNDEHYLRLVYLIASCTINKKRGDELGVTRFCPNPCLMKGICDRLNTLHSSCELADTSFVLHNDNYKCKCETLYEWSQNKQDCVLRNVCYLNEYCGGFGRSSHCEIRRTSSDLVGQGHPRHKVFCVCTKAFMGETCGVERNACRENYHNELPAGDKACGAYGICLPIIGSNLYRCKCKYGWEDSPITPYPDCIKVSDPCHKVKCTDHGFCKKSRDNKKAECVCVAGYSGQYCEKLNGQWLSWSHWSNCNPGCGQVRSHYRTRKCSDPASIHACYRLGELADLDFGNCDAKPCANFGNYTQWSSWNQCGVNCIIHRTRIRKCVYKNANTSSEKVDVNCFGPHTEYQPCPVSLHCDFLLHKILIVISVSFFFFFFVLVCHKLRVSRMNKTTRRLAARIKKMLKESEQQ